MTIIFDSFIASKYGIEEAIIYNLIFEWTKQNEAKGENYSNDRNWVTISQTAISDYLDHTMSRWTINKAINNLIKHGLIKSNSKKGIVKSYALMLPTDVFLGDR